MTYPSITTSGPLARVPWQWWFISISVLAVAMSILVSYNQPPVLAALLAIPIVLAIIARPDTATLVVVFVLYTNASAVAVKFHGIPHVIGASFILLLALPLFYHVVWQRRSLVSTPAVPLIGLYVFVKLISTLFSRRPDIAVGSVIESVSESLVLYLLIINTVRSFKVLFQVVWVLVIAGALMGALSCYQWVTGTFHNNYAGFAQIPESVDAIAPGMVEVVRAAGPIGEKNYYAQFMLMLIPLGMFRVWGEKTGWQRGLAALCTVFIAFGMVLAFSRGAAVGFGVMLVVMGVMRCIKLRHLAITLLGVMLLFVMLPQYGARLTTLNTVYRAVDGDGDIRQSDKAIQGRATEMYAAMLVWLDRPLIGVGPGMFGYHFLDHADALGFQIHSEQRDAHSMYLDIAAESGILGLLTFLGILGVTLRDLVRIRSTDTRPEVVNIATTFFIAMVALMASGMFLSVAYERYYWLILALAGVAGTLSRPAMQVATSPGTSERKDLYRED